MALSSPSPASSLVQPPSSSLTPAQVLKRDIPWETYMTAKDGPAYIRTFVTMLLRMSKEETIEYILAVMDDLLNGEYILLLSNRNDFIVDKSSRILALILSSRPKDEEARASDGSGVSVATGVEDVLQRFVTWLCSQLRHSSHTSKAVAGAVNCLSVLLREVAVRAMFIRQEGLKYLSVLITPASSLQQMQLLYEAILCVWLLTFYEGAAQQFGSTQVIPGLIDVAKNSTKEKVTRVAILSLKNLLQKANFGNVMVDSGLPKVVQVLKMQAWADEDLKDALDSLEESLRVNIKVLSSFEQYRKEVLSGSLEWTPMHKDVSFWSENIKHFEEHDFEVRIAALHMCEETDVPA
ncbi:hypothetical protein CBR_g3526 [Chara braunii]|uniref:ATPase V1 complex subunit H C-terminal domain-containing protein n=1 Tax=Chara braunii TaxID=69332 RepID=A0A388KFI8_CHABU|nr:hypothetical protein CBR_g3526 [Chara braunii]|eukprot:GBG68832.1 hypothetical protein CBR_g3526 [Chara braunii]